MSQPTVYRTSSAEETIAAGRRIAAGLRGPQLVLLIGDLGAGKTTLTKGIVSGLGAAAPEDVLSPTFALMHELGDDPKVYHLDLYRLDRLPELETLGLDDLWDEEAIVLIEWGEKFADRLPTPRLEIRLRELGDESREIEIIEVNA
ncbi:MAG: tRNA (adenosine(37)-N6)-threonylcarbamoyltransferase complex ATPase subunit type 1 TsaE [Acidobacteria bacterium]|nr:tRNA (adenosine(37)-N6)-threonylcarbamoyltransferase complex ATPase subunit type 1 TsaE [Acidobacteriota bacterium]